MAEIRFEDRVAVVTGGGGGLGKTYALELARRGAKVVVNDLGGGADGTGASPLADATVAEIQAAGGEALANYDSVSTPEGGERIVRAALDRWGRVDAVINNAGILRDKSFLKLTPDDLGTVIDVHLKGAFYVSQPAFKAMKDQGYGRFLFTSSASGLFGNFGQANYGAAKLGLVGLSNVLAVEGAKYGIKSNVIAPIAKTRMTEGLLGPLASFLLPEQVTALAIFLASDGCDLTHEIFSVGGGRIARVFVGLGPGWNAGKGQVPTVEDVRDQLAQIMSTDGYTIPQSIQEELGLVMKALS